MTDKMKKGKVFLTGAGAGDPQLITVRALEVIKNADCIIYDKLANPSLLDYAKKDAELIAVPKRTGQKSFTQDQINAVMIEKASQYENIVRLKGGDPCIFGRGTEEATFLAESQIDFEIIPGITSAIGAAEYAGIILTDRRFASQVCFVTGHEAEDLQSPGVDWTHLAKFKGTIVLYMAMTNLKSITTELMDNGLASDTSAAVIQNATLPTQRTLHSTLIEVADECERQNITSPSIVVIGKGAAGDKRLEWFTRKPLFAKRIVTTRNRNGNRQVGDMILRRGGNPIEFEAIRIESQVDRSEVLGEISHIHGYNWLVFTSSNGVRIFFDFLKTMKKDARVLATAKIAAIGPKTAEKLLEYGIIADFVPDIYTGEELGRQLAKHRNIADKKILLLRSDLATDDLKKYLEKSGAIVGQTPLYTVRPKKNKNIDLQQAINNNEIDWITFASPSSVRSFFEQIDLSTVKNSNVKIASIGPVTSMAIKELGLSVYVESSEHTLKGLLDAIEDTYK